MQFPKNKTHRLPIYRQIDNRNNEHLIKQTDAFTSFIKFKSGLVWIKINQVGEEGRGFYGKIELENTNGLMSWM